MSSASTPNLTSDGLPLRSIMKQDDDDESAPSSSATATTATKAVQIAEPELPLDLPTDTLTKKQFSAGIAKRLSGRPPISAQNSSRASLISQTSLDTLTGYTSSQSSLPQMYQPDSDQAQSSSHHPSRHGHDHFGERLITQVADWLENERNKKRNRKARRLHSMRRRQPKDSADESETQSSSRSRTYSLDSQSSDVSLDRLQKIIDDSVSYMGLHGLPSLSTRSGRRSAHRKRSIHLQRTVSSDTEWHDGDILVPSCDAVLDNSKTMNYSGGKASSPDEDNASAFTRREEKERKAWVPFKNEIIRLAHTLRLKGWRRVPLDSGDAIEVERLSGALTNAVYVVSPPAVLAENLESTRKYPAKLLLRVYGPQAEHIIDRENELNVLKRLARKKIGPRLLGTFGNGRFEQYLNATALTAEDLRDPETSKKIAKRMRELHDGIELLDDEQDGGAAVWKNWDSWLGMVSEAATFLDQKILAGGLGPVRSPADFWKERGLVCGAEWPVFRDLVDKFRQHLVDLYGGERVIRDQLVFAHSDTQYGNILRVRPEDKKSPLLQPNREHKQLVVIDFEYSAANTRGLEFGNHFTEWCYNYHDEKAPFICDISKYPKPEEQHRFIKSYINHRPEFQHPGASTPNLAPLASPIIESCTSLNTTSSGSANSIKEFVLEGRAPSWGWKEEERRSEAQAEDQIQALMEETKLWRTANSAQWVAWGIMQAKIPGFHPKEAVDIGEDALPTATNIPEEEGVDPDAFDYLGYAQDRAMFFWGDCVVLGLVKEEELPEAVRSRLKKLPY
ncbi:protein kinase-like domain-containing protein [Xylariomycetidae sp. FL2044]|nr:protein kinase-like domain-containing protein [Xylariomycetidae sp. FL2044]